MLNLQRLYLLRQFAVTGIITATAQSSGFSPSAVSQQLATLESELGIALFDRGPRSARLTAAGRSLAERAQALLDMADEIEWEISAHRNQIEGPLTVTAIASVAGEVAKALVEASAAHPGLSPTLRQVDTPEALAQVQLGQADLAVVDWWLVPQIQPPAGVRLEGVHRDPLVVMGPADDPLLRSRPVISVEHLGGELTQAAWVCAPEGRPSRLATDQLLSAAGVDPQRRWELEGLDTIAALVAEGAGFTMVPSRVGDRHRGYVSLSRLTPSAERSVGVAFRAGARGRPALAYLREGLRRALRPLLPEH